MSIRAFKLTAELASGGTVSVEVLCDPANLLPCDRELIRFFFERFMEPRDVSSSNEEKQPCLSG